MLFSILFCKLFDLMELLFIAYKVVFKIMQNMFVFLLIGWDQGKALFVNRSNSIWLHKLILSNSTLY